MTESTKKFVTEKLNEMINAFSCCAAAEAILAKKDEL